LGYQGSNCAYIWLSNPQATWWNQVIEKKRPSEIKGATIDIQGLDPGDYRVEWWHTRKSKIITESRISFKAGPLRISVPTFSRDIACKIKR
jgi:hypothetical protein